MMAFGAVLAVVYTMFGAVEVLAGLGLSGSWLETLRVQGSIMDGFVLLVIGAVFVFGLKAEKGEGDGFVLMGITLGTLFLAIYLALLGANLLSLLIFGSEHVEGWTLIDGIRPGLYLGLVAVVGGLAWRSRLSLARLSRAGA